MKVGIIGTGGFGCSFLPVFRAHPGVDGIAIAEALPERRAAVQEQFNIDEAYGSVEEICASDVEAVAIFTQRHLHGPMALTALRAGKHVYCAVPAGTSLQQLADITAAVRETGLVYMMGETSLYYPANVWCRQAWAEGRFGRFVYGEGEYLHDMAHGFYDAFQNSGGADWKRVAGVPPMYYPTHSVSMVLAVTGARMTHVSCLGYRDQHEDGIFREGANLWDNPFSNQTALFRTSDGGMARINEFRRVGISHDNSVRLSIFGTEGTFEQQADHAHIFTTLDRQKEELDDVITCPPSMSVERAAKMRAEAQAAGQGSVQEDFFSGYAKVHPVSRLPRELRELEHNGHYGSHHFLVDDFVRAVHAKALPTVDAWDAARFTAPGLVAHESALADGRQLEVPDFGAAPEGWEKLAP